ncbi:MAG: polysaccharide deacetylase family protein [Candidatus Latescibacterota bacterium]|nr:polysaccharide deacetylase family protein [Candidatus Latescibacterota bacterium]
MSSSLPTIVRAVRALPPIGRQIASVALGHRISEACMAHQGDAKAPPTVVLSFDCDFPVDVEALPTLCNTLSVRDLRGSFAVVGQWVDRYPEQHRAISDGGHELINHSHTHPNLRNPDYDFAASEEFTERMFGDLPRAEQLDELVQCHEAVHQHLGVEMDGCRLPHFGNLTPEAAYGLMREVGYRFSSSLLAVLSPTLGAPYTAVEGITEIPVAGCPAHPFTVFDTWHCLVKNGGRHAADGEFLQLALGALNSCQRHGGLLNLYFDPKDVVNHPDFSRFLDALIEAPVRVVPYEMLLAATA